MKCIVFLSGLLLHFLLLHWTESVEEQKMNLTTLAQIIDFFDQNYSNETAESGLKPFAVAINVPRNQCQGNFDPLNLPPKENATFVRNEIYKGNKFFKNDSDFIAAGLKECQKPQNCEIEPVKDLLEVKVFTELLKRRNDGCVVIYTAYYPCQNMTISLFLYYIIPALKTLKNHSGIKAFVFNKVYGLDENDHKCSSLAHNCTEIVEYVPLYRFVNKAVIPITKQCKHQ